MKIKKCYLCEKQTPDVCSDCYNDAVEQFIKEGKTTRTQEVLDILDSRTIECTSQFGEWYMKLSELKRRIQALDKPKEETK